MSTVTQSANQPQQPAGEQGDSTYTQNVCVRFKKQINSIAVDRSGDHCVLGGKKSLYIIKLEDPNELAKTISNPTSKWDIGILEWNPHASKSNLIASAANQEAHLWDGGEGRLVAAIPPHHRAVSDIGWNPHEPNVLLTASLDSYINLWDVRDPNRPLIMKRFFKHNGAVQAKWNRKNSNLLASAHEGMIFIWDIRKEGQPVVSITAHNTQIYGIDWSYLNANDIISCSQDKMVKLWSIDNPRECKMVLQTGTPVLRAKFLPFGSGIVTVAERGNNLLRLWSIKDNPAPTVPIHAYVGHNDVIRSFDWRISRPTEEMQRLDAIQMVSWSKDQTLRMWCFDNSHLAACGIYAAAQPSNRRGSVYYFGDLPADSPTINRAPLPTFAGISSPLFDVGPKTSITGYGMSSAMQPSVYMGDSLGEGYFGMGDFMGAILGEDEEVVRKGLLPSSLLDKHGGDAEGREEKGLESDKAEERSGDAQTYDGVRTSDASQGGLLPGMVSGMGLMRTRNGSFSALEDPGMIPGDLEHEFLLLKKKKFPGITIVQANSGQRTCIIHVTEADLQQERKFQLKITFPSLYPHNASPSFEISDIDTSSVTSTIPSNSLTRTPSKLNSTSLSTTPPSTSMLSPFGKSQISSPLSPAAARANTRFLENLKRVAELRVSHNMPCIESCLVKLVAMLREDEKLILSQIRQQQKISTDSSQGVEVSSEVKPSSDKDALNTSVPIVRVPSPSLPPQSTALSRSTPPTSNIRTSPIMPQEHHRNIQYPSLTSPDSLIIPSPPRILSTSPALTSAITSAALSSAIHGRGNRQSIDLVIDDTLDLKLLPHMHISSPAISNTELEDTEDILRDEFEESIGFPLANFENPTDAGVDTIDSNIENNAKVVRSKSTIELRRTPTEHLSSSPAIAISIASIPSATLSNTANTDPNAPSTSSLAPTGDANPTNSPAPTGIRRSRSMGSSRLSGKYRENEPISACVPSPRMCSVAISPTGRLVYFQTIHCKNLVLPVASSPQPSLSSQNSPRDLPLSARSDDTASQPDDMRVSEAEDVSTKLTISDMGILDKPMLNFNNANLTASPNSRPSPKVTKLATKPRSKSASEHTIKPLIPFTPMDDIPESASSMRNIKVETSPGRTANDKETGDTIKDKLKNKLKDLLKEKFKPKPVVKAKSRRSKERLQGSDTPMKDISRKLSKTSLENSIGNAYENSNSFTIKPLGYGEISPRQESEYYEDGEDGEDELMYTEDCSEDGDYFRDSYDGSEYDSTEESDSDDTRSTSTDTSNIINVINNIFTNKDSSATSNLTLPFFGTFPRTYAELHTILQGRKIASQLTTTDTAMLAQLKSLNSLRVSTKMHIIDVSSLMPNNYELAADYKLLGNLQDICTHNQAAARKARRLDLVKVWKTLHILCNPLLYSRTNSSPNFGASTTHISFFKDPWVALPIARNLISSLFKHYEAVGDVQTLAMISCVLLQSKLNLRLARNKRHLNLEEENEISLLDPKKELIALAYRNAYAELLSKWGLLVKRAELLKHAYNGQHASRNSVSYSPGPVQGYIPPPHRGVAFGVICSSCDQRLKDGFFCPNCKTFGFKCTICNLSVKGLSNFCLVCGHGGHANHMAMWFKRQRYCPAGCNCECIFDDTPAGNTPKTILHDPNSFIANPSDIHQSDSLEGFDASSNDTEANVKSDLHDTVTHDTQDKQAHYLLPPSYSHSHADDHPFGDISPRAFVTESFSNASAHHAILKANTVADSEDIFTYF